MPSKLAGQPACGRRFFSGTTDPNTVPIHTPSLASLDGNAYNSFEDASFLALYSDRIPNQDYYLWVIGARFGAPISQHVQIFGSSPPVEFDQIGPEDSLFLNDELGDSTRTLESYAQLINATDGGTISIVVKGISEEHGQTYTVAGLAIQEVPEPASLVLAGVGVLALLGCRARHHRRRLCTNRHGRRGQVGRIGCFRKQNRPPPRPRNQTHKGQPPGSVRQSQPNTVLVGRSQSPVSIA